MNELKVFEFESKDVRTVIIEGQPWWVAKDVADILGYSDTQTMTRRLDEDEKGMQNLHTLGGLQNLSVISEPGLYSAILGSNKPEAKVFKKWIVTEVIPSIRKTGGYNLSGMALIASAVIEAQKVLEQKDKHIAELTPKAEYFDALCESKDAVDIGTVAKILNVGIGRNKMFEILRNERVLMPDNQPYQAYIDRGFFRVLESKYTKPDGSTHIGLKTVVFQSGINYIRTLCIKKGYVKINGLQLIGG